MRIPESQQSVSPQTVTMPKQGMPQVIEGAFGGGVARAIEGLGDAGQKIAGAMQAHVIEKQRQKDEADLANYDNEYIEFTKDALFSSEEEKVKDGDTEYVRPIGVLNQNLGAASGSTIAWRNKAVPKMQELIAKGRTPEQQAKIRQRLLSTYRGADESVLRHEAKQGRLSHIAAIEANQEKRLGEAAMVQTPEALAGVIAISNENSDQLSQLKSLDPVSADNARKEAAGDIVAKAASAKLFLTNSLEESQALLDAAKDSITKNKYQELTEDLKKTYDTNMKRLDAEQKAIVRETKDELYSGLLDGTLTLDAVYKSEAVVGAKEALILKNKLFAIQNAELKDMTKKSSANKKFVALIDKMIEKDTDKYTLKEVLVDALADGSIDQSEAKQINEIKKLLGDMEFNGQSDIFTNGIKKVKEIFGQSNPDDASLRAALKKVIGFNSDLGKTDEQMTILTDGIALEEAAKVYPMLTGKKIGDSVVSPSGKTGVFKGIGANGKPVITVNF